MAYGNNYYNGYNPYNMQNNSFYGGFNQQPINNSFQPQNAVVSQPQPSQQVYLPLTFVSGIEEAKKFIVQPNQTIYLRDNNTQDILYIKSVDSQGTPYLQVKKLIDANSTEETKPTINVDDFVRKEDFIKLEKRVEKLVSGGRKNEQ